MGNHSGHVGTAFSLKHWANWQKGRLSFSSHGQTTNEVQAPPSTEVRAKPSNGVYPSEQPQRGSNPCLHLERVVSLAARRWGPTARPQTTCPAPGPGTGKML